MITAIIQARMSSTRLPGKVLLALGKKTILEHVVERTKKAVYIKNVVVATSDDKSDDKIVELCQSKKYDYFRGSLNDVLDRYYQTANKFKVKHICRITSDCPFIDPEIIDQVAEIYFRKKCDYISTGRIKTTYPNGLDVEIFSFKVLEQAWREAKLSSEREHVTPYIWKNEKKFKIFKVDNDKDLSLMRWTVDEEKDLKFVREIYNKLNGDEKMFYMQDILKILKNNQDLMKLNNNIGNNEGYLKSLRNDKINE